MDGWDGLRGWERLRALERVLLAMLVGEMEIEVSRGGKGRFLSVKVAVGFLCP